MYIYREREVLSRARAHTHTHTHTQAAEGFGILTVASVCPIISVLCVSGYSQYKRSQAAASDAHSRMA